MLLQGQTIGRTKKIEAMYFLAVNLFSVAKINSFFSLQKDRNKKKRETKTHTVQLVGKRIRFYAFSTNLKHKNKKNFELVEACECIVRDFYFWLVRLVGWLTLKSSDLQAQNVPKSKQKLQVVVCRASVYLLSQS